MSINIKHRFLDTTLIFFFPCWLKTILQMFYCSINITKTQYHIKFVHRLSLAFFIFSLYSQTLNSTESPGKRQKSKAVGSRLHSEYWLKIIWMFSLFLLVKACFIHDVIQFLCWGIHFTSASCCTLVEPLNEAQTVSHCLGNVHEFIWWWNVTVNKIIIWACSLKKDMNSV